MFEIFFEIASRFMQLVQAPLTDQKMLWAAVPLLIATLFMTLYFGKYKKEELGWNTAFGNTMVFLFVSLNIIQYIYYSSGTGSWDNVFSNSIYFSSTFALLVTGILLMLITYYHLLPKKVAFFLFSAPPVNVAVYVIMTIIYTGVAADFVTMVAALLLFFLIFMMLKGLQFLESMAGSPEGLVLPHGEPREKFLKKLKERNIRLQKIRPREKEEPQPPPQQEEK